MRAAGHGGIRAKVGDVIEATFVNRLSSPNTVHCHGTALRNDMDGVDGYVHGIDGAIPRPRPDRRR